MCVSACESVPFGWSCLFYFGASLLCLWSCNNSYGFDFGAASNAMAASIRGMAIFLFAILCSLPSVYTCKYKTTINVTVFKPQRHISRESQAHNPIMILSVFFLTFHLFISFSQTWIFIFKKFKIYINWAFWDVLVRVRFCNISSIWFV